MWEIDLGPGTAHQCFSEIVVAFYGFDLTEAAVAHSNVAFKVIRTISRNQSRQCRKFPVFIAGLRYRANLGRIAPQPQYMSRRLRGISNFEGRR